MADTSLKKKEGVTETTRGGSVLTLGLELGRGSVSTLGLGLDLDEAAHTAPTVARWATGCNPVMGCVDTQQPTLGGSPRAQAHFIIGLQPIM